MIPPATTHPSIAEAGGPPSAWADYAREQLADLRALHAPLTQALATPVRVLRAAGQFHCGCGSCCFAAKSGSPCVLTTADVIDELDMPNACRCLIAVWRELAPVMHAWMSAGFAIRHSRFMYSTDMDWATRAVLAGDRERTHPTPTPITDLDIWLVQLRCAAPSIVQVELGTKAHAAAGQAWRFEHVRGWPRTDVRAGNLTPLPNMRWWWPPTRRRRADLAEAAAWERTRWLVVLPRHVGGSDDIIPLRFGLLAAFGCVPVPDRRQMIRIPEPAAVLLDRQQFCYDIGPALPTDNDELPAMVFSLVDGDINPTIALGMAQLLLAEAE